MKKTRTSRLTIAIQVTVALSFSAGYQRALAAEPGDITAPAVEVISTTPLPGLGVPKDSVPGNVQTANDQDLRNRGALTLPTLSDFMQRNLDSVNVNDAQANPFQPDVNFRGFSASPILGTPQGLSVFQDGVRINEPFGDTVNWDLVPKSAISEMTLIPGSNPVFGLNTLGGALAVTTKDGFDYPGFVAEVYGGSFKRRAGDFEYGGHGDKLGYFVTGNYLDEGGWRDYTSSRVRQGFGKLTYRGNDTDLNLSFTGANNTLFGGQTVPVSFLNERRDQAYTFPDIFDNQLAMFNLEGKHNLSSQHVLQGNVYYRSLRSRNFSTNINDEFDAALDPVEGENVQSNIITDGYGAGLQYSYLGDVAGKKNRVTVGTSLDGARTDFGDSVQEANFAADRSNVPLGGFTPGTQVRTENQYYGIFLTDTYSVREWMDVTVSGRYNRAHVEIDDVSGTNPDLNGTHDFNRFNPAAGLTFRPLTGLTAYVAYNEGMRIPTPVELTCADPAAPCTLPNEFLADPPLKPIIARTVEAGLRGRIRSDTRWRASAYQTTLRDDILFISTGSSNAGFFQNVGTTRRRGFELGLDGKWKQLSYAASYAFVDAQFRTTFSESSPGNPTANNGVIVVPAGSRIPGIPRNILKLRAEYAFGSAFFLGGSMYAASSQYARGNENNAPGGKAGGYAIFNLDARWRVARGWEVFGEIHNLFNRDYNTLGVFGRNFFNGPGHTFNDGASTNELFFSPGAPLGAWIGVRYSFGRPE